MTIIRRTERGLKPPNFAVPTYAIWSFEGATLGVISIRQIAVKRVDLMVPSRVKNSLQTGGIVNSMKTKACSKIGPGPATATAVSAPNESNGPSAATSATQPIAISGGAGPDQAEADPAQLRVSVSDATTVSRPSARIEEWPAPSPTRTEGFSLKEKLAEVRRRIGYIQKRGHNERFNYTYVTAADLASAVGDALADLGVVIVPRLESIAYESVSPNQGYPDRFTRVVMTYTFMDVNSAEELTVKMPGEGRDPGDKGPYKAMTGALKYALLQSFLIATGDDPEDERADGGQHAGGNGNGGSDSVISAQQVGQIYELIEQTGTDVAKMLEYFKISNVEEMTASVYGRALQALKRKPASAANRGAAHA